jgi:hypothetical protein
LLTGGAIVAMESPDDTMTLGIENRVVAAARFAQET